ncbi:MAG: glycosyltransferase [Sediminibacterium sp.]|nr:glycosyltransferase [Sediminibacterium sp.]TXT32947.1 MAG: group 1 glycosyl transferase [Chitinophagaceae bacterium]
MPRLTLVCTGMGIVQRGFETYMADLAEKLTLGNDDFQVELYTGGPYISKKIKTKQLFCISRNNRIFNWLFGLNFTSEIELVTFFLSLSFKLLFQNTNAIYLGEYKLYCYLFKFRKLFKKQFSLVLYTGGQVKPGLYDIQKDYVHHITDIYYGNLLNEGYPAERQFIIPHFITDQVTYVAENSIDIRKKAKQKKVVISIGLIDKQIKRMDLLVEILAKNSADYFPVILGEFTKDTPEIINSLKLNFGLDGYYLAKVEREAVFNYLNQSDIFILLSPKESFGLASLEALSVGLPVITCDYFESRYVLKDYATRINNLDSNNVLKELESSLITNNSKLDIESRKKFVNDHYSWANLQIQYRDMFFEVLGLKQKTF